MGGLREGSNIENRQAANIYEMHDKPKVGKKSSTALHDATGGAGLLWTLIRRCGAKIRQGSPSLSMHKYFLC